MENVKIRVWKNDYFRKWIIEEWKHHNTVDPIYQLIIKNPEQLSFQKEEKYYKIVYGDTVVGFIGIKDYKNEIYLYRFFIDEKYRNQGIGTKALEQLIHIAKSQNKDLSLDVMENNNLAKKLYEKMGFKTHFRRMVLKTNDNIYLNVE